MHAPSTQRQVLDQSELVGRRDQTHVARRGVAETVFGAATIESAFQRLDVFIPLRVLAAVEVGLAARQFPRPVRSDVLPRRRHVDARRGDKRCCGGPHPCCSDTVALTDRFLYERRSALSRTARTTAKPSVLRLFRDTYAKDDAGPQPSLVSYMPLALKTSQRSGVGHGPADAVRRPRA